MSTKKQSNTKQKQRAVASVRSPKVTREYYDDPEALADARFTEGFRKWLALEAFHALSATDMDWRMLEYWAYFTQAFVAVYDFGSLEQKAELQEKVELAFQALTNVGQSYNQSKHTFMYMTVEERDDVRDVLLLCDELLAISDDKMLNDVINHLKKIL